MRDSLRLNEHFLYNVQRTAHQRTTYSPLPRLIPRNELYFAYSTRDAQRYKVVDAQLSYQLHSSTRCFMPHLCIVSIPRNVSRQLLPVKIAFGFIGFIIAAGDLVFLLCSYTYSLLTTHYSGDF